MTRVIWPTTSQFFPLRTQAFKITNISSNSNLITTVQTLRTSSFSITWNWKYELLLLKNGELIPFLRESRKVVPLSFLLDTVSIVDWPFLYQSSQITQVCDVLMSDLTIDSCFQTKCQCPRAWLMQLWQWKRPF